MNYVCKIRHPPICARVLRLQYVSVQTNDMNKNDNLTLCMCDSGMFSRLPMSVELLLFKLTKPVAEQR